MLSLFRANGYKTYTVTGTGQDFVRIYSDRVYGMPREQVVGSAGGVKNGYDKSGKPFLTKEPKLLLNDNYAGKPEEVRVRRHHRPGIEPDALASPSRPRQSESGPRSFLT